MAAASAKDHNQARPRRGAWAAAVLGAALLPLVLLLLLLLVVAGTATATADAALGVPLPHGAVENLFRRTLNAESARGNLRTLTSVPHQAGSVGDFRLAKVRYERRLNCKQQTPPSPFGIRSPH